jgi:hypothetical protein
VQTSGDKYSSLFTRVIAGCGAQWPRIALCTCMLLAGFLSPARAAKEEEEGLTNETSVFLVVRGIGGREVPATIMNETAYLSVTDVFDFLKIRSTMSGNGDTVSGFFITEQNPFVIDKTHNLIVYKGAVTRLRDSDLVWSPTSLFMKRDLFKNVFELDCAFSFRGLSVTMSSSLELPAVREMRLEAMRNNINRLNGQVRADTVIGRSHPLFRFGMADWAVVATQRQHATNDARVSLSLGGVIAGGEATLSLNYNNYSKQQTAQTDEALQSFDRKMQFYRWRYVNNDNPALRQVIVGKLFTQAISSIYDPVVGVQLTNAPTTFRRSFGTYTLSNVTEPNWTVELYVNNELVDYTRADAAGAYTFQVPMVYGNSVVRLRFYGPFGEERTREERVSVPFNFLPQGEFEYSVNAGMVEDRNSSRFGRAVFNYGATRFVTLGGGVEYLSSVSSGTVMPFATASLRLTSNLLLTGDYVYGVRARGILSYRLPSNLLLEASYVNFREGQRAINFNYREERRIVVSRPFTGRKFSVYSRLTLDQFVLPGSKYINTELLLSGAVLGVRTNLTTYAVIIGEAPPFIYSNFSTSFRLPGRFTLSPQVQYEYNSGKVAAVRCEVEKYIFRNGYLSGSCQQNFKSQLSSIGLGLRYDFSVARTSVSAWHDRNDNILVQSASGSLIYDGQTGHVDVSTRLSVGTGGITVAPFLDLNRNGRRDAGEPRVAGVQVAANGGYATTDRRDTTVRILNLEPYTSFFIDLSRSSFDNIAWQLKTRTMRIAVEPNTVRLIEVPVEVMGEASGTVYLRKQQQQSGIGRISVSFYRQEDQLQLQVLTEADGSFSFIGLPPGNYVARIDPAQLQKLGMTASPAIPFTIRASREGDLVEDLKFVVEAPE